MCDLGWGGGGGVNPIEGELLPYGILSGGKEIPCHTGGHFVNKLKKKLPFDLKWREMRSKVIFGHPKWPPAAIMCKHFTHKSSLLI